VARTIWPSGDRLGAVRRAEWDQRPGGCPLVLDGELLHLTDERVAGRNDPLATPEVRWMVRAAVNEPERRPIVCERMFA
jgi:hypothetical protein